MPKTLTQDIIDKIYEAHDLGMTLTKAGHYAEVNVMTVKKYLKISGLKVHFERNRASKKNNETNQNKIADGYNFGKPLRRITLEKQIPGLFDSCDEKSRIDNKYLGKIDGVNAKIIFNSESPCFIYTKKEEDLEKAYNKTLDRLINR